MILDGEDDLDRPSFKCSKKLGDLEEQLYGHVRAAVDLGAISCLEQHVSFLLSEDFGMDDSLAIDLSRQIIDAALRRVIEDPTRYVSFGAPDGITEEEKEAVAFDETCQFCLAARRARERAKAHDGAEPEEEEYCACCEMLRDSWREKHADVLAKAGLAPPSRTSASTSAASAIAGAIEIAKRDRARRAKPS